MTNEPMDETTNARSHPRITVVTPSFNQGQFIEETIVSVIGQNYANLEYIVMDGGSSDNTVEIIKRYEKHISYWQSAEDGGQAAAINAGFARASGTILAWLNSDDFYLPGTLRDVAARLDTAKNQLLLGNCFHFFQNSARAAGSDVVAHHAKSNLLLWDYIVQPSAFWTRRTWEKTGELNEQLHFAFDWEWFIRARQAETEFMTCQKYLSAYRFHEAHKTGTGGSKRRDEIARIYRTYAGPQYEELFRTLYQSRGKIGRFQRALGRLKLSALDDALLKLAFPAVFKKYRADEIEDVIAMCHD